ncbi:MAG TPA: hypothetical protein DCW42_02170 [Bacteroidetes bacterium]|nr:hypothetical protein [Bacteroidota bacterium]
MEENTNLIGNAGQTYQSHDVYKMGSDMKWTAIYVIIMGALSCIGIVTALIGVPMILAGLRLNEAAKTYQDYSQSQDPNALAYAFERQSKSFAIIKILIIVYIVLSVVSIICSFIFLIPFLNTLPVYNGF